jgi:hypothetical protein
LPSGTPGITRISLYILYAKYLLCRVSLGAPDAPDLHPVSVSEASVARTSRDKRE